MSEQRGAGPRRRPGLFKYYGGKARLAPWIVENLPPHQAYCEPFSGGARVLFAKPRCRVEVINDLDQGVVAAMQAARDYPNELATVLALTPYARAEYSAAAAADGYPEDLLERARQFLIIVEQGFNAQSRANVGSWRIQRPGRATGLAQKSWARLPEIVLQAAERLQGVAVECRDAFEVFRFHDSPETLFYMDPPYHPRTCDVKGYRHVMSVEDHERLAELLGSLQGMVVLSGYHHPDYEAWYTGWPTLECETACAVAAAVGGEWKRREVLWFNPLAWGRRAVEGQAEAG
ncbi:MAG: DNA adenine methylase [Armatimonadetes bacterium]|nr:DNA adenine methylase [Armatimonadota bacterium]